MIDHISVLVSDLDASVTFYTKALAPLGYELIMRFDGGAGFGSGGKADFWIGPGKPTDKVHIAFRAGGRAAVRAFYEAARAAGGVDNGPPGVREEYHPDYYSAFVLRDADGHNVGGSLPRSLSRTDHDDHDPPSRSAVHRRSPCRAQGAARQKTPGTRAIRCRVSRSRTPRTAGGAIAPNSLQGRDAIVAFLTRKWARELDYLRLIKELWAHDGRRISVRFQYEFRDDSGTWYRAHGNEQCGGEFDDGGLMRRREASINDVVITEADRKFLLAASGRGRADIIQA